MEILGKVLSEKTEAIYKDITGGLIYPIKIVKLDPENEEDCSRPVAMDTGKKEFIVKVDNTLADNLFENALIRDIIYCQQMSNNAPVLTAKSRNDIDGFQVAMVISSIIMDIDVENKLRSYDMHIDDIDTMRLSDLYAFLKSGMADYNRELYNVFTGLQITLLYFQTLLPLPVSKTRKFLHSPKKYYFLKAAPHFSHNFYVFLSPTQDS